jgi:hypothetical protein
MRRRKKALIPVFLLIIISGIIVNSKINIFKQISLNQQTAYSIPITSASALTQPPPNLEDINTHTEIYGTGADPDIITLGPKTGGCEGCPPYKNKTSMEFELKRGTPILAPIDMVLIGFNNRNAERRTRENGEIQTPYDDLELSFESASPDWPGMIICVYHLQTSPMLRGQGSENCDRAVEWMDSSQVYGHQFYDTNEIIYQDNGKAGSCKALMGRQVKRGEVIGYAGNVGDHSMASFRFKVSHTEKNPTVKLGNPYLHWVQPGSFFYWKCYSPDSDFPPGVLAYPFPCDEYTLPLEQYDVDFKYTDN